MYPFNEMKRVATAAVLIPLVLLLIFLGPPWLITLVAVLVAELALWEYLALADATGAKTPRIATMIAVALLFLCVFRRPDFLGRSWARLLWPCSSSAPFDRRSNGCCRIRLSLFSACSTLASPYHAAFAERAGKRPVAATVSVLRSVGGGHRGTLCGPRLGTEEAAPRISPGKTWEGSVASIAGSVLMCCSYLLAGYWREATSECVVALSFPGSMVGWLVLAVILNIAAQLGDLVESAIKRGAGVKIGELLSGHGASGPHRRAAHGRSCAVVRSTLATVLLDEADRHSGFDRLDRPEHPQHH